MSKRKKLRQKLRNNPKNATLQELQTLLNAYGFVLVRIRGSHYIFEYESQDETEQIIILVHGHKVKWVYTQTVTETIDALFPEVSDAEEVDEEDQTDE
jgi:predicted RNA binding protein YcfA (HicA-like mRNA interferase family)